MDETAYWKYAVVGNIVKTHIDENGILRYGTSQYCGGTKVYLCGRLWDFNKKTIEVAGLSRGKHYQVHAIDKNLIENVRFSRTYKPAVLDIMDDFECSDLWWHDSKEDRQLAIDFVEKWNKVKI